MSVSRLFHGPPKSTAFSNSAIDDTILVVLFPRCRCERLASKDSSSILSESAEFCVAVYRLDKVLRDDPVCLFC